MFFTMAWESVVGWENYLGVQPATQANTASHPERDGKEYQPKVTLCGLGVKPGMAHHSVDARVGDRQNCVIPC